MNDQYIKQHEDFISGNTGGSSFEICLATQLAACFFIIKHLCFSTENATKNFVIDFCALILPLILFLTVLNKFIITFFFTFVCIVVTILLFRLKAVTKENIKGFLNVKLNDSNHPNYLTSLRGYLLASTAICILVVDFQIFPRRFVKTEIEGTSLMDAGVGHFVFYGGIVARHSRSTNWGGQNLISTLPLWILGIFRLLTVKSVGYQEHLTEYGIHWNFFMTLALVKTATDIALYFGKPRTLIYISLIIPIAYEMMLNIFGLKHFILSDDLSLRIEASNNHSMMSLSDDVNSVLWNIFYWNRSGILSSIGFFTLNLVAILAGRYIVHHKYEYNDTWSRLKLSVRCFLIGICVHIAHAIIRMHISETSRRLANLAYITWMIGDGFITLSTFMFADIIVFANHYFIHCKHYDQGKSILSSLSYNGLLLFLISNLLTGLVNITFQTIYIESLFALLIVTTYMFLLTLIATILHINKLKFKFW